MVPHQLTKLVVISLCAISMSACSAASNILNPFYETPGPIAYLGSADDHALNGTQEKEDTARDALEAMASYNRAHSPKPQNPVLQPAVVRLMWVPDHLNRNGDLVPAHYYYLRVLDDRFAVTDAFELEAQLGQTTSASSIPFVYADDRKNR